MQPHEKSRPRDVSGAALTTAGQAVPHILPFAPSAGGILAAVDAIRDQQTYTREQVTYLTALAYRAGRVHGAAEDIAEDVACWREYAAPQPTREQRIAERIASMAGATPPPPLRYDDPDWPPVAVPGTVDVAQLTSVWPAA